VLDVGPECDLLLLFFLVAVAFVGEDAPQLGPRLRLVLDGVDKPAEVRVEQLEVLVVRLLKV
jgi:hypothetical protein